MDFNLFYESADCTGSRAHDASAYCGDPTRKPRGVIVQSLLPSVCRDYVVTQTLELDGSSSTPVASFYQGASSTCRAVMPASNLNLLKVSKTLNPEDVFVPLERTVKD